MGQRTVNKILILVISIFQLTGSEITLAKRQESLKKIYIILDTNDLNIKKFNLIKEDWSFNISNLEDSNLDVSLSHTPSLGAAISQISLYELHIGHCKVANNLKFQDWLLLKQACDQNTIKCYLIFQDAINHSNKFVYGYSIDAYEVKIRTGSTE